MSIKYLILGFFLLSFKLLAADANLENGYIYSDIYNEKSEYSGEYEKSLNESIGNEHSDQDLIDYVDGYQSEDDFDPDSANTVDGYNLNDQEVDRYNKLDTDKMLNREDVYLEHEANVTQAEAIDENSIKDQANDFQEKNSCDVSRDEKIVCGNIVCDFGIWFGEWSSECTDYKLALTKLRARTPPWKSLPKCMKRDEQCNDSGRAQKKAMDESYCYSKYNEDTERSLQARHECLNALQLQTRVGAEKYLVEHNQDPSIIDDVEFVEPDPETVGNGYIISVDERYEYADDLTRTYHGSTAMDDLTMVLKLRHDGSYSWELEGAKERLYEQNKLRPKCLNVPDNQFYNCNNYPDLPQECWASPSENAIASCLARIQRRKERVKAEAQAAKVINLIDDLNVQLENQDSLEDEKILSLNEELDKLNEQLNALKEKISQLSE